VALWRIRAGLESTGPLCPTPFDSPKTGKCWRCRPRPAPRGTPDGAARRGPGRSDSEGDFSTSSSEGHKVSERELVHPGPPQLCETAPDMECLLTTCAPPTIICSPCRVLQNSCGVCCQLALDPAGTHRNVWQAACPTIGRNVWQAGCLPHNRARSASSAKPCSSERCECDGILVMRKVL